MLNQCDQPLQFDFDLLLNVIFLVCSVLVTYRVQEVGSLMNVLNLCFLVSLE
jgi:hypothetical protein